MSKEQQPIDQEAIQSALADLAGLEKEFEMVDVDILRETTIRQAPLFTRRNALTSRIHNFWPLTFEQASSALQFDEFVTPEDAHILGKYLRNVNVTRPDLTTEPRSVRIEFTFDANEYFADEVLAKTFEYQPSAGGLASKPVTIGWKEGKDLTEGVTAAAAEAWEERVKGVKGGKGAKKLEGLMEKGPTSFFNWFAWTGRHEALGEVHEHAEGGCDHGHDEEEEDEGPVEVFPNGDEVAVQISEDMYPNAPKYFTEALEEGDDEDDDEEIELDSEAEEELAKNGASALLAQMGKKGKRNGAGEAHDSEDDGPAKKKSRK
ncbi:uncharacterized protein H6S33_004084 [Morchella sextelata]|uniref:uncharacterized protein n=1 Tax=Morchella sextelata TaxID=1174677 RepID=UPI001D03E0BF|nr:uncharacterized protein H6S33_004084 [Morchella sextelata]KAH0606423.1 hypothetical protein H6S33_004084 [Morchella sextelata]